MTGNRSLDEFAGTESATEAADPAVEESSKPEPDPVEDGASDPADADVQSIESTYDWTPGGAPCAMCGESVEERWRDAEGLVCIDCKVW